MNEVNETIKKPMDVTTALGIHGDNKQEVMRVLRMNEEQYRIWKLDYDLMWAAHMGGQPEEPLIRTQFSIKERKEVFDLHSNQAWCISYSYKQMEALLAIVGVSEGIHDFAHSIKEGASKSQADREELLQSRMGKLLEFVKKLDDAAVKVNDVLQDFVTEEEGIKVSLPDGMTHRFDGHEHGDIDGSGCAGGKDVGNQE